MRGTLTSVSTKKTADTRGRREAGEKESQGSRGKRGAVERQVVKGQEGEGGELPSLLLSVQLEMLSKR